VNTKSPHISTSFGDKNTGEVNKALGMENIIIKIYSLDPEASS
jgi:hypothetical protein